VLPVVPARGQIIISEPISPLTKKIIISLHHMYMRQTVSGTCQIGSHTELVGPSKEVTLAKLREYTKDLTRILPFFKKVKMLRAYAGLRPLSPDSLPIVEEAPGIEGLILACGHSRTGVSLALFTGKIVSELLLEDHTSFDISHWSLARFGGKSFEECYNG
jgi:sarcosine oxidase subunit beta